MHLHATPFHLHGLLFALLFVFLVILLVHLRKLVHALIDDLLFFLDLFVHKATSFLFLVF